MRISDWSSDVCSSDVGIGLAALLWGFLERSAQRLDLMDVPKEIVVIMQGTIVLSVVVAYEIVRRIRAAQLQREVSAQTDAERVSVVTGDGATECTSPKRKPSNENRKSGGLGK